MKCDTICTSSDTSAMRSESCKNDLIENGVCLCVAGCLHASEFQYYVDDVQIRRKHETQHHRITSTENRLNCECVCVCGVFDWVMCRRQKAKTTLNYWSTPITIIFTDLFTSVVCVCVCFRVRLNFRCFAKKPRRMPKWLIRNDSNGARWFVVCSFHGHSPYIWLLLRVCYLCSVVWEVWDTQHTLTYIWHCPELARVRCACRCL